MKIKEVRKAQGMNQEELAYKAGVTIGTLSNIERGLPVSRNSIKHVCRALGIEPEELDDENVRRYFPSKRLV